MLFGERDHTIELRLVANTRRHRLGVCGTGCTSHGWRSSNYRNLDSDNTNLRDGESRLRF